MSDTIQFSVEIEPDVKDALDNIKKNEGIALSYQVRMGLLMWLESKGVNPLAAKKRGAK